MFTVFMGFSLALSGQTCPQDQTAAHFGLGTTGTNTVVVPDYDGAVILTPASNEEFTGNSVPSGWVEGGQWTLPNGTYSYGGSVVVNGTHIYSSASYNQGTSIEFVATFTAGNYQNVGFSSTGAFGSPWFTIGRATQVGTGLYARTSQSANDLPLGENLLNAPHLYKIVWNASSFQFYVDGVLLQTMNYSIPDPMYLQISDYVYDTGGLVLTVDCIRTTPFVTSGTYTSRIFDGVSSKNWGAVTWNADVPFETGVAIYTRSGDVAVPDGTWSNYTLIPTSGSIAGGSSRYIQYQAVLTTSNTLYTPALKDISITCTEATVVAPTVTDHPDSQSSCAGRTVVFESAAYGFPAPVVQWQVSTDGGSTWSDITGATNPTLSVVAGASSASYKAIWSNSGGPVESNTAVLTIGITASIETVLSAICEGGTAELRLASATGKAPWSLSVNGTDYTNASVGSVFTTFSGINTPQTYNLTSVTDADGCITNGSPTISSASVSVYPLPVGTITAPVTQVEQGQEISLDFNATAGNGSFNLIINGDPYFGVLSGTSVSAGASDYTPLTIWGSTPGGEPGVVDNVALELGVKFRSSVPGLVKGIRFYKRVQQTGTHTGTLWTSTGTLLATGTFTGETESGWQEMYFSQPVLIQPNVTYVASYYAPNGHYAFNEGYFTATGYTNGPLTALQSGFDGPNGLYLRGGGFPTDTFNASNYWVDVLFDDGSGSSVSNFDMTYIASSDGCVVTGSPVSSATVTVNRNVWTGNAGTDWSTPASWSLSSVPGGKDVMIPVLSSSNYPVISGNVTTTDMTLWPTAGLTINGGGTLTVNGDLTTTGANFEINSGSTTSNGSLIVNGTATGNVTYNRLMPTGTENALYRYISLPVSSTSFPAGSFWRWDEVNGRWGEDQAEAVTTEGASGIGYTVAATGTSLAFTGTVLTGPVNISATAPYDATHIYQEQRTPWGGGGWNLLGNPYPSAIRGYNNDGISDNDFITHNQESFDPNYRAIYIYNGANYYFIAASTPGYPDLGQFSGSDVQAGQGFFVLAKYNNVPFEFTPAMRTHNTVAEMMKSAPAPWPGLQLKVKYGETETATLVVYKDGMSTGLDAGYDIGHLSPGAEIELYTHLAGGGSDFNFTRQALPSDMAGTTAVPVGLDFASGGEVTFSAYTIPLEGSRFWLEDKVTGTITDLNTKSYTVTLPANSFGTGRFYIIASANSPTDVELPGADNGGLKIWNSGGRVIIQGEVSEGSLCEIYTMNGSMIAETRFAGGEMNSIALPAGSRGMLIVKVTDGPKVVTRKIAVPGK